MSAGTMEVEQDEVVLLRDLKNPTNASTAELRVLAVEYGVPIRFAHNRLMVGVADVERLVALGKAFAERQKAALGENFEKNQTRSRAGGAGYA